jgi:pimeloyl-ACP methyl ester carboxylesterase
MTSVMHEGVPGARIGLIRGAGRFPHWERPEAIAKKPAAFVDGDTR